MKLLNGKELAAYIQQRQVQQVRGLTQTRGVQPRLAIVQTKDDPVINTYVRLKQQYGQAIGIDVVPHRIEQSAIAQTIKTLNDDVSVHGIIVQLPLQDIGDTDHVVRLVSPGKDVDALGSQSVFEPATPMAIMWLFAGYNIDLRGKTVLLVGRGKLVGAPLEIILRQSGVAVSVADRSTPDLSQAVSQADIVITATGSPAIIQADMLKAGAIVVDAGVASEDGKTVGDVAPGVYDRTDITITPPKGGVGPLTVCALFENVIRAVSVLGR